MNTKFTTNLNQEPVSLKIDAEKKQALKLGSLTLGSFLGGLGTMALLGHSKTANAVSSESYDEFGEGDEVIEIMADVALAQSVNDSMTFNEAFASARIELGAGGFFTWQGRSYNTYYADEWTEMSADQQDQFLASVEQNASYETHEYTSGISIDQDAQNEIILGDVNNDGVVDIQGVDLNNDGNIDIIHVAPEDITVIEDEIEAVDATDSNQTEDTMIEDSPETVDSPHSSDLNVLEPAVGVADSDGNDVVDSIAYDKDFDGNADTVIIDINEDGYGDVAALDSDFDGDLDVVVIDENQNGFDENDPSEDIDVEVSMDEFIIVDQDTEVVEKEDEELFEESDLSDLEIEDFTTDDTIEFI